MKRLVAAGRTVGTVGAWLGVASAGAAVGFAAERYVMGRSLRSHDPYADEPFGSLRGEAREVMMDDGVVIQAEVDEPADRDAAEPTIVFSHGFALTQDAWHFQRRDLRDTARLVFWDQRGHGRSGALPDDADVSFERLGADLGQVIDAVAPTGPVVLVGHSMGAMTVAALAAARPEEFGDRITGVALIATSAHELEPTGFGLPGYLGRLAGQAAPGVVSALARRPQLVERSRQVGGDLAYVLTRRYAFAESDSSRLVEFTAQLNAAVGIDVIAEFFPLFGEFDASDALMPLRCVPTFLLAAEDDLMTPVEHGRVLAEQLPDVEYVEVTDAGHMVLLERHELVTAGLADFIARVRRDRAVRTPRAKTRVSSVRHPNGRKSRT